MRKWLNSLKITSLLGELGASEAINWLKQVQLVLFLAVIAWFVVRWSFLPMVPPDFDLALIGLLGMVLLSVGLTRQGHPQIAGGLVIGGLWSLSAYILIQYGIDSLGLQTFSLSIILAVLLIGARGSLVVGGAALGVIVCVGWLETTGRMSPRPKDMVLMSVASVLLMATFMLLVAWVTALRARMVSQLRRRKRRFMRLVEESPDALLVLDGDWQVVASNPEFERMLGYSNAYIKGRSLSEFPGLEPEDLEALYRCISRVSQGEGIETFEVGLTTHDDRRLMVEVKLRWLEKVEGDPAYCMLNLRDASERKALEAKLREAAKMETVGRLAAGVAHDFNNLLQTILTSTEMLSLNDTSDAEKEDLEAIRVAALRGAGLVQKLSAFGRRQALQPRRVDLNELVSELQDPVDRMLGEDVELMLLLSAEPMMVEADVSQLEQVIINLALNAREAMHSGGRLTLETGLVDVEEHHIPEQGASPGMHVSLVVRDTGSGIPVEIMDKIFEPFFTTRRGGSGMGLASAQGILSQSGGAIRVSNPEGGGARLELLLPAVAWHATPTPTPIGIHSQVATILLVEDRHDVRVATHRMLEQLGYTRCWSPRALSRRSMCGGRRRRWTVC